MWYIHPVTAQTVLDAVADSHRRDILDLLREREHSVSDLVAALAMSQPLVSKHLRALRDVGLVESSARAQWRIYRLRPTPLRDLDRWLTPYRALWSTHLDRLETHLNEKRSRER
jgi:DNA-binding transcriptional ArsR family regulator